MGPSSKVGAYGSVDINRDHTPWGHRSSPELRFKTRHKPTTTQIVSLSSEMFYTDQLDDIQPEGMTVGVRLQNIHGT